MLVLTRKQQDTIRIGEDVVVTVVRIKGNIVRLGIDAPQEVRVVRGEVDARDKAAAKARAKTIEFEVDMSALEGESTGEPRKPTPRNADEPCVAI